MCSVPQRRRRYRELVGMGFTRIKSFFPFCKNKSVSFVQWFRNPPRHFLFFNRKRRIPPRSPITVPLEPRLEDLWLCHPRIRCSSSRSLTRGLSEGGTGSPLVSLHNDLERREGRTEMSRAGKRFLTRRFLRLKILSCFHVFKQSILRLLLCCFTVFLN